MKTELVNRKIFTNIIIWMVTMAISGCFALPVVEYTGGEPGTIKAGTTSKAKIINIFGYPKTKTSDGRFFLYNYSKDTKWCWATFNGMAGGCGSNFLTKQGRVLIEFDNDDIVEQYVAHTCRNLPDSLCDQPGTDTMWTLINQLAGEDVAAQYGQTLGAFRQAEAQQNSRTEALVKAVKLGDLEAVKRLIDEGTDVDAQDSRGTTPLQEAERGGDVAVIKLLLAKDEIRLAVALQNSRTEALVEAVKLADLEAVKRLIDEGADVNARDSSGTTPLHGAVTRGDVATTKFLLMNGARVDYRVDYMIGVREMPLHTAIRLSYTVLVQLLLTHGADPNAKSWFSRRPVRYARYLGEREDIIELLKQYGGKE
jgi:ankyrin repeat protein